MASASRDLLDGHGKAKHHDASLDARRIGANAGVGGRRALDGSGVEPHFPRVQRADHGVTGDDAVAQWSALMRTLVIRREKPVAEVEERNRAIAERDRTP